MTTHAAEPTNKTNKIVQTKTESIDKISAQNKKIVVDFYEGVFLKHQVKEYADRYIGHQYIQHNPNVPDGKAPFVNFFTEKFQKIHKQKMKLSAQSLKVIWWFYTSTLRKMTKIEAEQLLIFSV